MQEASLALIGAALTMAACWASGALIWQLAKLSEVRDSPLERFGLELALGAAIVATTIFLLCAFRIAYPAVFALMWCCIAVAWWRWGRTKGLQSDRRPRERLGVLGWLSFAVLVSYLGIYFVYALAPETTADAVTYHLGLVRQYAQAHGFLGLTTNIYAFMPMGSEMLFLNAYVIGAHSAAKLVHWALTGATVLLLIGFAERQAARRVGWVAAVLYVCSPSLSLDASSAYNDCALAFFMLAVFVVVARWWECPRDGTLIAMGILGGFCFAVKYTGGVALLSAAGMIFVTTLWRTRKPSHAARNVLIVCGVASIFIVPWLLKNIVVTGNPVSPLFNAWFPNPYVTDAWEQNYRETLRYYNGFGSAGWPDYLTAPLELTVWGERVTGITGPAFLLLPVALLGWRSWLVRALVVAAAVASLPWLANAGARFLIPALPFAALLIALGLERLPWRLVTPTALLVVTSHALLSWPYFVDDWHPSWTWRLEPPIPWKAALRLIPEEEYLAGRIDAYTMVRRIDEVAQPGDKLLSLEHLPEAYMDTPVVVCYQGALPEQMYWALRLPYDQSLWPLDRVRVPLVSSEKITGFRVTTTNSDDQTEWAVSEMQFLNEGTVLPSSGWRVDADPFPWDAERLVDGDDVSTWYSGETLVPQMTVEVRFPSAIPVTEVLLIHPVRQRLVELKLEYRTNDGEWRAATAAFEPDANVVDEARLKRWAGQALRKYGITLLLVNTTAEAHNFVTPGIVEDPAAWGFQEVLREGSRILYRVMPNSAE